MRIRRGNAEHPPAVERTDVNLSPVCGRSKDINSQCRDKQPNAQREPQQHGAKPKSRWKTKFILLEYIQEGKDCYTPLHTPSVQRIDLCASVRSPTSKE
ncbi:hypothetical protein NMY22_g7377 [Coprinellus aureogranulatus]|nr:hypothetical protein NMY22_g7377 [Coprinellus aureogranulatus]